MGCFLGTCSLALPDSPWGCFRGICSLREVDDSCVSSSAFLVEGTPSSSLSCFFHVDILLM